MAEKKACIRCSRGIDEWSKICPFCNWDQTKPVTASAMAPSQAVSDYKPAEERSLRKRLLMGAGLLLLLVASFGIGAVINRDGAPDEAPPSVEEQAAAKAAKEAAATGGNKADTTLVPLNEPIAPPITSAPALLATPGAPAGGPEQRLDATAVSSVEYAQLAAREQADRQRQQAAVDPRTLTGPAYAQQPVVPRRTRRTIAPPPGMTRSTTPPATGATPAAAAEDGPRPGAPVARTRPVVEYQPIPSIRVDRDQVVRADLQVGADGRVKDVRLRDALPGESARLIATIQQWRFKPATENGVPVAAPVSVDISFRR